MLGIRVRTVNKTQAAKRQVEAASYNSLGHAAGSIRKIARRSIRRRKKPSSPGFAPHTQTGTLKNAIRYEVKGDSAAVGPVNTFGGRLWDLFEFGGRRRVRHQLKAKRHRVGEFGPIRKGRIERIVSKSGRVRIARYRNQFQRVELRTRAQAARADRLVAEENARRKSESQSPVKYAPRPFMGPALAAAAPQLPRHWRGVVR